MRLKLEIQETATLHLLFSFFLQDPSLRKKDREFFVEIINNLVEKRGKYLYMRREQYSHILEILTQASEQLPSAKMSKSIGTAITSLRMKLIDELTEDQKSETSGATIENE